MSGTNLEINSLVNDIYVKSIITQRYKNDGDYPREIKIYINKNKNYVFSSFTVKIGDSSEVKSKVIRKNKAEEKYTDSIASGNASVFISDDPDNKHRIIINIGNIPPGEELIFTCEYLQFLESSNVHEFELFRNLPLLSGLYSEEQNKYIKGSVEIKTTHKIINIEKILLAEKLNIIQEKYINENKCEYLIQYEYKDLSRLTLDNFGIYIPSSRILFETENNGPISYFQKSLKGKEISQIIQYKYVTKQKTDDDELKPSLFIFLIDQSGSMSGNSMQVANKALILFLQSLPAGSYYQVIGFGSHHEKYDKVPKEYTQENIKESIKFIETLKADKGGTDIYHPLKDIYSSTKDYENIKLPKNIFLLTDGEVFDKKETLQIIEENSNEFFLYSIGIGKIFDKDLIKNAGILGQGNYNFCVDIEYLNEIVVNDIKNSSYSFAYDFEFDTKLNKKNIYPLNSKINMTQNHIANIKYIIENKKDENINGEKLKLNLKYKIINRKEDKIDEFNENYEIIPEEIQEGNELSKLIINDYLLKNEDMDREEQTKLALKYQVFTKYTSLFAEIELSDKITEGMKTIIIGKPKPKKSKLNNYNYSSSSDDIDSYICNASSGIKLSKDFAREITCQNAKLEILDDKVLKASMPIENRKSGGVSGFFKSIGNSIKGLFKQSNKNKKSNIIAEDLTINKPNDDNSNSKNEVKKVNNIKEDIREDMNNIKLEDEKIKKIMEIGNKINANKNDEIREDLNNIEIKNDQNNEGNKTSNIEINNNNANNENDDINKIIDNTKDDEDNKVNHIKKDENYEHKDHKKNHDYKNNIDEIENEDEENNIKDINNNKDEENNKDINIGKENNNKDKNEKKNEENKIENKTNNKIDNAENKIDNEDKKISVLEIKKIIDYQNFVEGYWEINEKTKKIQEIYENEFKLLKELKNKKISDNIAITILIVYCINKEHSELLKELFMIIQKAKKFIKKNANDTYENILKEIGIKLE